MFCEKEQIKELLRSGKADLVPYVSLGDAIAYVESLKWCEPKLDWKDVPCLKLNLFDVSGGEELLEWKQQTCLEKYSHIVFVYAHRQPGLIMESSFAFLDCEDVFWAAPGLWLLFGASYEVGELQIHFRDFCEYDGIKMLTASSK